MRGHLSFYTLALALGFSALGAGAIHLPVLVTFALLVIASGGLSWWSNSPRLPGWIEVLAGVALALSLFCLLQALPLPLAWLEVLAPRNADIWARALKPFQVPAPEFASISLAPGRTLREALQFASYGVVIYVSAQVSREHGVQRMLALAFGCALAVAAVTAVHQLVGAERLYGQYQPLDAFNVAPLLNPNNRAGYLNLGFFCGLGLLFRSGSRPYLGLVGLGLCFLAAETILCRSLGGTTSLAIGWGMVVLLLLSGAIHWPTRGIRLRPLARAGILSTIGLGALLLALAGQGGATLGLDARSWEKAELWRRAARLAEDHFALGIGRGAFASVFPAYQGPTPHLVFEHAENLPIQWAAEWGIPVTLTAFLLLGWSLAPIFGPRTLKSSTRRCALVGCVVLLLQNFADLALELPAVAALLCAVLGALRGSARKHETAAANGSRRMLLASCALTLICVGFALAFGTESTARLRHELYAELARADSPPASFWKRLEQAVRAYPAEPYFPLLGSSAALAAGMNAVPWISRALEREPESAAGHLQLARILRARGATPQALGAVRRAIELDPELARRVPNLAREWGLDTAAFEAAAPVGKAGSALLTILANHVQDISKRLHLLEESLVRDPSSADTHYRLALELLEDVARKEAGVACADQRDRCLTEVAAHLQQGSAPGNSRTVVLESWLLAEAGQPEKAEEHLERVCPQFAGDVKCLGAWVARALQNDSARLQDSVNALVAAGCTDPEGCASTHLGLGTLFSNAGRWHSALSHYQHATQESPSTEAWQAVARAAERLGDDTMAADARRRMALLAPGDARATDRQQAASPQMQVDRALDPLPQPHSGD